jgi:hypothetical protein
MGETTTLPRARRDDLLIEDVVDEILIYDTRAQQAHCLNAAAAAIWRACDGQTTLSGLAEAAAAATGEPWDEALVGHALEQLRERDLIDLDRRLSWPALSRRQLMGRLAASAALPLITSLAAPTPAMAQSGITGPQGPQGSQGPQGPQG